MVKYFCDKCGKEVDQRELKHCVLYVKNYKTSLREIELTYCPECFENVVGKETVERINSLVAEREARKKERK